MVNNGIIFNLSRRKSFSRTTGPFFIFIYTLGARFDSLVEKNAPACNNKFITRYELFSIR